MLYADGCCSAVGSNGQCCMLMGVVQLQEFIMANSVCQWVL